ncbi:MAG TPA: hypothetical protein VII16_17230 [Actinomycetes bacterium]|jgi:hypothetical protein
MATRTVMPKTLNVVHRVALNATNAPTVEGGAWGSPDVFFKPHHDEDAVSQYAVASTRLARFLGMPEVIARNAFARVKGSSGVVSGAVPGSPLVKHKHDREMKPPKNASRQQIAAWVKHNQLEERGGKYYAMSQEIYEWIDFSVPRIQKGMSDLQLFDAITGQLDRHGGNIFIDPQTGQVSGIDDDKSFGEGMLVANQGNTGGKYAGLPALVDKDTAERILALDPTNLPEELLWRVNDSEELTEQEIEDAVRRFVGVQLHVRQLQKNGALIGQNNTSWNDATYQQALQDPTSSYLGRSAKDLDDAIRKAANDPDFVVLNAPPPQPPQPPPTATTMPQPPQVMPPLPPLPRTPWQPPTLPLRVPPITLQPQPSALLGPESPRTGEVSPSRATAARLAARRSPRLVVEVDGSGDSSEDSTTDDQALSEQ